jgi:hypothetical protein
MVKLMSFLLLAAVVLGACTPASSDQPADSSLVKPLVTVYREPT